MLYYIIIIQNCKNGERSCLAGVWLTVACTLCFSSLILGVWFITPYAPQQGTPAALLVVFSAANYVQCRLTSVQTFLVCISEMESTHSWSPHKFSYFYRSVPLVFVLSNHIHLYVQVSFRYFWHLVFYEKWPIFLYLCVCVCVYMFRVNLVQ